MKVKKGKTPDGDVLHAELPNGYIKVIHADGRHTILAPKRSKKKH